jgi:hypothetical protein
MVERSEVNKEEN